LYHSKIPLESKPVGIDEVEGQWQIVVAEPDIRKWTAERFKDSKAAKNTEQEVRTIPLVLVAARLSDKASHGVKRNANSIYEGYSILCIPCLLDQAGGLWPDRKRHPWIPRDFLEPSRSTLTIGQLDVYDEIVSSLPYEPISLSDTLQFASDLFKRITGTCLPLLRSWSDENTPTFMETLNNSAFSTCHPAQSRRIHAMCGLQRLRFALRCNDRTGFSAIP